MSVKLYDLSKGDFEPGQSRTALLAETDPPSVVSFMDFAKYEQESLIGMYVLGCGKVAEKALIGHKTITKEELADKGDLNVIQYIWDVTMLKAQEAQDKPDDQPDDDKYSDVSQDSIAEGGFLNIQYEDIDGRQRTIVARHLAEGMEPLFNHAGVRYQSGD